MGSEARDPKDELRLLAALVHRGQLPVGEAESLAPRLQAGESLDDLLLELGRDLEWIARMRRTNAGEIPELVGYEIGERLGVGGTAVVWKALEKKTRRKLALKVLRPEMTVTLRIALEGGRDAFCVPNRAIRTDGQGSFVLIRAVGGGPLRRGVTIGFRGREFTEVVEGLAPTERVLVAQ